MKKIIFFFLLLSSFASAQTGINIKVRRLSADSIVALTDGDSVKFKSRTWFQYQSRFDSLVTFGVKPTHSGYNFLIASDSTVFRTFSDIKYVPMSRALTGGYGINTIGDLYSDRTISIDSATLSSKYIRWNDTTIIASKAFVAGAYQPIGTYLIPSDTTVFRGISDSRYALVGAGGSVGNADSLGSLPASDYLTWTDTTSSIASKAWSNGRFVTSVSGTSPIVSSGGLTPTISLTNASNIAWRDSANTFTETPQTMSRVNVDTIGDKSNNGIILRGSTAYNSIFRQQGDGWTVQYDTVSGNGTSFTVGYSLADSFRFVGIDVSGSAGASFSINGEGWSDFGSNILQIIAPRSGLIYTQGDFNFHDRQTFSDSILGVNAKFSNNGIFNGYLGADSLRNSTGSTTYWNHSGYHSGLGASYFGNSTFGSGTFNGEVSSSGRITAGAANDFYVGGTLLGLNGITQGGTSTQFDINPYQSLRLFRNTNNASSVFQIFKADGTGGTTAFSVAAQTGNTAVGGILTVSGAITSSSGISGTTGTFSGAITGTNATSILVAGATGTNRIHTGSSDGSDANLLAIGAGGTTLNTRGGNIYLYGNQHASADSGKVIIVTGTDNSAVRDFEVRLGSSSSSSLIVDGTTRSTTLGSTVGTGAYDLYADEGIFAGAISGTTLTTTGLSTFGTNYGTATTGAGDSVQVTITGISTSSTAVVSYYGKKATTDIPAGWAIYSANTLSIYGTNGSKMSYSVSK